MNYRNKMMATVLERFQAIESYLLKQEEREEEDRRKLTRNTNNRSDGAEAGRTIEDVAEVAHVPQA